MSFLRAVQPLLPVLRQCFDAGKFNAGLQEEHNRQDSESSSEFNAAQLDSVLKENFFHAYVEFALEVDDLPERALASWGEGCPCHEALFKMGGRSRRARSSGYCVLFIVAPFSFSLHLCSLPRSSPPTGCALLRELGIVIGRCSELIVSAFDVAPKRGR